MAPPVSSRFRLSAPHAAAAVALFVVEVLIALFLHDGFVRPYVGDVLVVLLIHHTILSLVELPAPALALGVLAFAYAVEGAQYLGVSDLVGDRPILQTVVGTTSEWEDLVAYAVGAVLAMIVATLGASRRPGPRWRPGRSVAGGDPEGSPS